MYLKDWLFYTNIGIIGTIDIRRVYLVTHLWTGFTENTISILCYIDTAT